MILRCLVWVKNVKERHQSGLKPLFSPTLLSLDVTLSVCGAFGCMLAPHPHRLNRKVPVPDLSTLLLTPCLDGCVIARFQPQSINILGLKMGSALAMASPGLAQHATRVQ